MASQQRQKNPKDNGRWSLKSSSNLTQYIEFHKIETFQAKTKRIHTLSETLKGELFRQKKNYVIICKYLDENIEMQKGKKKMEGVYSTAEDNSILSLQGIKIYAELKWMTTIIQKIKRFRWI